MECSDLERVCHLLDTRPSIAFYKNTLGAEMLEEWRGMRLEGEGIDRLANLAK